MTHLLRETGARLWSLLGEQGAHLYVCGDAKMMAKDVRNIVREICQVKIGRIRIIFARFGSCPIFCPGNMPDEIKVPGPVGSAYFLPA